MERSQCMINAVGFLVCKVNPNYIKFISSLSIQVLKAQQLSAMAAQHGEKSMMSLHTIFFSCACCYAICKPRILKIV